MVFYVRMACGCKWFFMSGWCFQRIFIKLKPKNWQFKSCWFNTESTENGSVQNGVYSCPRGFACTWQADLLWIYNQITKRTLRFSANIMKGKFAEGEKVHEYILLYLYGKIWNCRCPFEESFTPLARPLQRLLLQYVVAHPLMIPSPYQILG